MMPGSGARALVVTFHSQPGTQVGGLRWWGLSRHLAARGWEVNLLTATPGADGEPVPPGMEVRVVRPATTLNDRYRSWRRRSSGNRGKPTGGANLPKTGGTAGSSTPSPEGAFRCLRREMGGLLGFPDEGRGWILRAGSAVQKAVADFQPDVVVSSGPPHSAHLAALAGLQGRKVPWVVDFRDPWSDEGRAHLDVAWAQPLFHRLEATVVESAEVVLTTTPELAAVLADRFGASRIRYLTNGVDRATLPERSQRDDGGLSVVHLGTLYHRRDPVPVVRAFARFLRRNPLACRPGSRMRFIGNVHAQYEDQIQAAARDEGILDRVVIGGLLPWSEALEVLAESGVALVLAQDQGTAIPAKIYESVAMGVPTLVVAEDGSATAAAGRRLGGSVHPSEDQEGMACAFEAAWTGRWDGSLPPGVSVDYADVAVEAEAVLLQAAGCAPARPPARLDRHLQVDAPRKES